MVHVPASGPGINLTLVTRAGGTLSLLLFHKVRPVIRSISPAMMRESCALNAGLPIGFSAVITRAGAVLPLPLLPPLPLPLPGRLGNVVARMLRLLEGTLRCTDVDLTVGQSSRVDDRYCFLQRRLFCLSWFWTEYELVTLLNVVWELRVVPKGSDCVLLSFDEALLFSD